MDNGIPRFSQRVTRLSFEQSCSRLQTQNATTMLGLPLIHLFLRHILSTQTLSPCGFFPICYFSRAYAYFNGDGKAEKYFYYVFESPVAILSMSESNENRNMNSAVGLRNVSENFANIRDSSFPHCAVSGE